MGKARVVRIGHWLVAGAAALMLSNPVAADQRVELLIGPHRSTANLAEDRAQVLVDLFQQKLNTMPEEVGASAPLEDHIFRHIVKRAKGIGLSILDLRAKWNSDSKILILVVGQFFATSKTYDSTFFVGQRLPEFKFRNATINLQATENFRNEANLANLILFYAIIREAKQHDLDWKTFIVPLLSHAFEIAKTLEEQGPSNVSARIVEELKKLSP